MLNFIIKSGILVIIVTGLSTLINNYLINKWKSKHENEMLKLKEINESNNKKIDVMYNNFSIAANKSHGNSISAVDKLWRNIMTLRELYSMAVHFYTVLKEDEYNRFNNQYMKSILESLPNDKEHTKTLHGLISEIEACRIFISESLFSFFSVYASFTGRIVYKLKDGYKKRKIEPWYIDKGIKSFLSVFFSEKEIKSMSITAPLGIRTVQNAMELKILNECKTIIYGEYSSNILTQNVVKTAKELSKHEPDKFNDNYMK